MDIFMKLRRLRSLQKQELPQLKTIEDFDIVRVIGHYQEMGSPLSLKLLFLEDIASLATVQRRARRLTRLGVVLQKRSKQDKRNIELTLSQDVRKAYRHKELLLRSA